MPTMRLYLTLITIHATLCIPAILTGQEERPLRVAYVNLERVLKEAAPIRARIDSQERKLLNLQNQVEGMLAQQRKLSENLNRQMSVLSEAQLQDRRTEIADLNNSIKDLQKQAQAEIQTVESSIINPFLQTVIKVTENLAKEQQIDLIFRSEQLIFAAESMDLTDAVIKAVEADFAESEAKADAKPDSTTDAGAQPPAEPTAAP